MERFEKPRYNVSPGVIWFLKLEYYKTHFEEGSLVFIIL